MSCPTFDKVVELTGSDFTALTGGMPTTRLLLKHVSGQAPSSPDTPATPVRSFSLLFEGACEPVLPQQTYEFEHANVGAFDLFIVPLGPDKAGGCMRYEAVFN